MQNCPYIFTSSNFTPSSNNAWNKISLTFSRLTIPYSFSATPSIYISYILHGSFLSRHQTMHIQCHDVHIRHHKGTCLVHLICILTLFQIFLRCIKITSESFQIYISIILSFNFFAYFLIAANILFLSSAVLVRWNTGFCLRKSIYTLFRIVFTAYWLNFSILSK